MVRGKTLSGVRGTVVFAALVAAATALTTACSGGQGGAPVRLSDQSNGIVHGKEADGTEPWAGTVVGLGRKLGTGFEVFCSATLLNENTVITAAHCVRHMSYGEYYIVFGLKQNAEKVVGRKITERLTHEKYISWFPEDARDVNDIGMAQFEGGMPEGYHAAELLSDDTKLANDTEVVLAGYGVTDGTVQSESGTLRYVSVKIRDSKYGVGEVETDETNAGSCNGDSGGPGLIAIDGKYYLWGATSRGDSACSRQGVYTKVTAYKEWIDTSVATWKNKPAPAPSPSPSPSPSPKPTPFPGDDGDDDGGWAANN